MSAKKTVRQRRWRLKLNHWIKSSPRHISREQPHHHLSAPSSPDAVKSVPATPAAKAGRHIVPILPQLPKVKTRHLEPRRRGVGREDSGDDDSDFSREEQGATSEEIDLSSVGEDEGRKRRKFGRASSMPPIVLGDDTHVPVPPDWDERRAFSLIERRSSKDYTLTLTDFLQDIFNEQMEGSVDYKVPGASWRAGLLKVEAFELVVKDVRKQAHLIGLSIVVDLSSPHTRIASRDHLRGLFIVETEKGILELRDRSRFGSWIDVIERKQLIAQKLSS